MVFLPPVIKVIRTPFKLLLPKHPGNDQKNLSGKNGHIENEICQNWAKHRPTSAQDIRLSKTWLAKATNHR